MLTLLALRVSETLAYAGRSYYNPFCLPQPCQEPRPPLPHSRGSSAASLVSLSFLILPLPLRPRVWMKGSAHSMALKQGN
jgi:hypothetical protein